MEWLVIGGAALVIFMLSRGGGFGSLFGGPSSINPLSPAQQQAANAANLSGGLAAESAALNKQETLTSDQIFAGVKPIGIGTSQALFSGASAGFGAAVAGVSTLGAVTLGIGVAAIAVWAILSKHHAAAVKNEAKLLNTAYPTFEGDFNAIIKAYKARQITGHDAQAMLDQIRVTYYTAVTGKGAGSIQGKWTWQTGPKGTYAPWQQGHPNVQGAENPTSYADVPANHKQPATCNGPCVVGHWWVEGPIENAKEAIRNSMKKLPVGQGPVSVRSIPPGTYDGTQALKLSFQVGGAPPHAGYQGSPPINYAL